MTAPGVRYGSRVSFEEDLIAEGEPEREFNPGIASRMPRKRVAAGALFHDQDRFLMVEPVYKPTWDIPGGVANSGESPLDTCSREIREELGIEVRLGTLLVVDWLPSHGVWGDAVNFIFDGGALTKAQLETIQLQDDELKSIAFVTLEEASERVKPSMYRRLSSAMKALERGYPLYLQFGREVTA